uniref:Uncharacterized protein n=1 Tax=Opuntia streptacantha TaxID=393608 RepID=A0A7C9AXP4_OPUST
MVLAWSCGSSSSGLLSTDFRFLARLVSSFETSLSYETDSTIRFRSTLINLTAPCSDARKWSDTMILHRAEMYDFSAAVFFVWKPATSVAILRASPSSPVSKSSEFSTGPSLSSSTSSLLSSASF